MSVEPSRDLPETSALSQLLGAAKALRAAQRAYMADRGNDALGKIVGQRATELDAVIASLESKSGDGTT